MKGNQYFKATPLYKEYRIFNMIDKDNHVTQRKMAKDLDISVSMVNRYLSEAEEAGYVDREYTNSKNVAYHLTPAGLRRLRSLDIGFLKASQKIYANAKTFVLAFLKRIIKKGIKTVLLYGAGDVAEIILHVIKNDKHVHVDVPAIIDDDTSKQNKALADIPIIAYEKIQTIMHDGIIIASHFHNKRIYDHLLENEYEPKKIFQLYDQ